jgi:signal peptide peptidase SppA
MRIIDVLTSPWAIVPDKLTEIAEIYNVHLKGEKIDLKIIEAQMGRPLEKEKQGYEVIDGVAVIPIDGVIAKKMNMFTRVSGGASTQMAGRDFQQALRDPTVRAIVLNIDSPGGSVDGTFELANLIYESRGKIPIVAHTDGMMASAAYAIGSAADKIYISGNTTQVGSIGVIMTHYDYSQQDEKRGIKITHIVAGKYKAVGTDSKPLSDEDKTLLQADVDYLYSVFVGDVARNRGVPVDQVLSDMAEGKVFIGKTAVTAGLVDGVSTLDKLISKYDSTNFPSVVRATIEGRIAEMKTQKGV